MSDEFRNGLIAQQKTFHEYNGDPLDCDGTAAHASGTCTACDTAFAEANDIVYCELCGEPHPDAEMYQPLAGVDAESVICHSQCGLDRGMEIA